MRFPLLVLLCLAASPATGQTLRPGRLPADEVAALRPGLMLTLTADGASDRRVARLPALYLAEKVPAAPFLPPGPFKATWSGYLKAGLKGAVEFRFAGRGEVTFTINGISIHQQQNDDLASLPPSKIELAKGYNKIELDYTPPASGPAEIRLLWSGEGYGLEPLPPDLLFHDSRPAELVKAKELRLGRELFATRHCTACHELEGDAAAPGTMPELASSTPNLQSAGRRLEKAWIARWLLDPQALQPHATMPKLLGGLEEKEAAQHAADLAAFAATLEEDEGKEPAPLVPEPTDEASIEQGRKLFENLGCIACHRTSEPTAEDAHHRRSLHYVAAKFQPGALAVFLQSPHADYKSSRMPDFRLSAAEATALAACLRKEAAGKVEPLPVEGDVDRGHALYGKLGCNNCHPVKVRPMVDSLAAAAVLGKASEKGCLAATGAPHGAAPDFGWNDAERTALKAFVASQGESLWRETPVEYAQRQIERMRCTACHRRDGQNGALTSALEDEGTQGLIPEILPLLTWTGEKLQPAATERLVRGQPEKARHWLKARMPGFALDAKLLAAGLSHGHGMSDAPAAPLRPDPALVEAGRRLIQAQGGLDCVKCHALGDKPAVAPFEAPGINLAFAAGRVRPGYYHRWMLDPPRVDNQAKMPKFAQDGQTTGIREILGGDARQQYEAIWHFLHVPGP